MHVHYQDRPWLHPSMPGHPERAHRVAASLAGLADLPEGDCTFLPVKPVDLAAASSAHDPEYLAMLGAETFESIRRRTLDGGDTVQAKTSLEAALEALGGARAATDAIMSGRTRSAMLVARPAGHHATRGQAMGFCLLGAAGWAAIEAQRNWGARVAVLDFDLHHGNGTQDILHDERDIFFASTHQDGIYPGTGAASETGAHGQVMNVPLPRGSGGKVMREAWQGIFRAVADFHPDLILVSAGFDAHGDDPLSDLNWCLEDYRWLGRQLAGLADSCCDGRILSILEGGYDLRVLRHAVAAWASQLCELDAPVCPAFTDAPKLAGWQSPYLGHVAVPDKDAPTEFVLRKMHRRLWIENARTGQPLWTPPDFIRLEGRELSANLVSSANENGSLHIDAVIALEAAAGRAFGYNSGRSRDFDRKTG
ncbi:MAG: hypothetical protein CMO01_00205 [Thalassobius sp.]|nr:hypothetical protein [Thalassovita sp.]